ARIDDRAAPDREVTVRAAAQPLRILAAILPAKLAGRRVEGLDVVAVVRHEHHAVVHERRRLLNPRPHRLGPDELEPRDVLPIDLIERAVTPAVERPPPHQPVGGIGITKHLVRDRTHAARALSEACGAREREQKTRTCRIHGLSPFVLLVIPPGTADAERACPGIEVSASGRAAAYRIACRPRGSTPSGSTHSDRRGGASRSR